jgi:ADP-dependent phosphofructokinase/glucokinase
LKEESQKIEEALTVEKEERLAKQAELYKAILTVLQFLVRFILLVANGKPAAN